jgi:hypothetical protein
MKVPIIKKLAETYSAAELRAAERAIEEGESPAIEIPGEDEGEQLTHAFAAAFIKEKVENEGEDLRKALREYTQKVRKSIS